MTEVLAQLREMSTTPSEAKAFAAWLELSDATGFLKDNALQDEFVVYAGLTHVFIHAVLVPAARVTPPNVDDLLSWSFGATSSWGISQTFTPDSIFLSPPLDHTG